MTIQSTSKGVMEVESALVQEILTIAEGFISENRVLEVKQLYKEIRKHIRIEHKSLLAILNYLLEKRILVEGSKLTKELVLVNAHRKKIYEYIKTNRGANFSTIRREYEGSTGSPGHLIWHLQVLLQFAYIKRITFRRFTIFLPIALEDEEGLLRFLVRNELNRQILGVLRTHERLEKADLFQSLEASREQIYYHLNLLMEANVISAIGEGDKEICLSPAKRQYLEKILDQNGGKI